MTRTNTIHAAKTSWARANKLHQLSEGHYTNYAKGQASIPTARKYLAANKTTLFDGQTPAQILDTPGITKKHKLLRFLINDYNDWLNKQAAFTPSQGDPTRPPRAGAPRKRFLTPDQMPQNTNGTGLELLQDLAKLAKKHGGLPALTKGVARLHELQL